MVLLRANQQLPLASFSNGQAVSEPKRVGSSQPISIEADITPDVANHLSSIPERQRNGVFRLSRLNPNRCSQCAIAKRQFDNIAVLEILPCCQLRTDEGSVAPDQLGKLSRQFLKPAIVGVPAVAKVYVRTKQNLQVGCWILSLGRLLAIYRS